MTTKKIHPINDDTPLASGYRFPAEWELHEAIWLTFPVHDSSFPGRLEKIINQYVYFVKQISLSEKVNIIAFDNKHKKNIASLLGKADIDIKRTELFVCPTDDVWCRDHGPTFLIKNQNKQSKMLIDWEFNGWGNKFPHERDNKVSQYISAVTGHRYVNPGIVMEGGAVDTNGLGTLITTSSCLLNSNRNPGLNRQQIEYCLRSYYCAEQIIWLDNGIEGDDTDGHVDNIARFFAEDKIITMVEPQKHDKNHRILNDNLRELKKTRLLSGKQPDIVEIPMPAAQYENGNKLPASYANFYFTNNSVIVPVFNCPQDDAAVRTFESEIKNRKIIPLFAGDFICSGGSFHCLTQQEPRNMLRVL
jgi:agmatine deiminase